MGRERYLREIFFVPFCADEVAECDSGQDGGGEGDRMPRETATVE